MSKLRRRQLFVQDILAWADAHREATGRWPTRASGGVRAARFETWSSVDCVLRVGNRTGHWPKINSGPVLDAPGERWDLIDNALTLGLRGLSGGSSLLRLLVHKRAVRNPYALPTLSKEQIMRWAWQYFRQRAAKVAIEQIIRTMKYLQHCSSTIRFLARLLSDGGGTHECSLRL